MSLVIGIKCSDGVIVGADTAATVGGLSQNTIRQSARKIHVIDDRAVVGSAGLVGLAQRYHGELTGLLQGEKDYTLLPPHRLMVALQQCLTDATHETMASLALARRFSELGTANSSLGGTLIAMKSAEGLALFSFDQVCNPEGATSDLPFVCVGSGAILADPFLAHVKRVLWNDEQPHMSLGLLSIVWTLNHVIGVNPGGITAPFDVYQMTLDGNGAVHIEKLQRETLEGMESRIEDIEQRMREIATKPVEAPPKPPRLGLAKKASTPKGRGSANRRRSGR